jgi:hypothetical protein
LGFTSQPSRLSRRYVMRRPRRFWYQVIWRIRRLSLASSISMTLPLGRCVLRCWLRTLRAIPSAGAWRAGPQQA